MLQNRFNEDNIRAVDDIESLFGTRDENIRLIESGLGRPHATG